eukprot:TRINITY_DN20959_c1_g1_i1.p2 TRINITY_DN20959_c1_g1~~TRINITY_DN20959_c1_g1_i1.p2  ORF type:complete len:104 (-),score=15.26 TRINITY_DN20959_c1_g1_i1:143-454(-)
MDTQHTNEREREREREREKYIFHMLHCLYKNHLKSKNWYCRSFLEIDIPERNTHDTCLMSDILGLPLQNLGKNAILHIFFHNKCNFQETSTQMSKKGNFSSSV